MPRLDPDTAYAMKFERECIEEDTDFDFRRFRRVRLRYYPDANPTEIDIKRMASHGGRAFRVRIGDLLATQAYVNIDTVRKYVWQIRSRGVCYLSFPNVELVRGRIVVVDGHHRIEAFRRLGRKTVAVRYHPSRWE